MAYFYSSIETRRSSVSGDIFNFNFGSYRRGRRTSQPKICTFDCSNCRKLMLTSVSERNISSRIVTEIDIKEQSISPSASDSSELLSPLFWIMLLYLV